MSQREPAPSRGRSHHRHRPRSQLSR